MEVSNYKTLLLLIIDLIASKIALLESLQVSIYEIPDRSLAKSRGQQQKGGDSKAIDY